MKRKTVWNVIIWRANGDEVFRVFVQKPDFANIYPLIDCDMIEYHKGYDPEISNRSFDMLCDEEAKLRSKPINYRATKVWKRWANRTGHLIIPGDTINGDIAILKKVTEPNETEQEVSSAA